jgi:hypothetical protein
VHSDISELSNDIKIEIRLGEKPIVAELETSVMRIPFGGMDLSAHTPGANSKYAKQ